MRAKFIEANKPERYIHAVRNVDSGSVSSISTISNSIPAGTPVILNLSSVPQPTTSANGVTAGFEDGLQVCLPASAANNMALGTILSLELFHYGVAVSNILYNQLGEVMVHGVYPFALLTRATRSASTASWTSSASIAGGALLSIDSLNNAYLTVGTANASNNLSCVSVVLLDSVASFSASASNTSDTRTAMVTQQRVFIREM